LIGETIASYRITAKQGSGGMGDVYRATDTRLGCEVAIKFSHEQFSDRFEREAHAVVALNHPNICTLYDVGPNFLVMEYVEGESPKGPLPRIEALRIARQTALPRRRPASFSARRPIFRRSAYSDGYLSYFGTYTIDQAKQTVTHHIRGASYPNWVDNNQVRFYRFKNNRLFLSTPALVLNGQSLEYVLIWERVR